MLVSAFKFMIKLGTMFPSTFAICMIIHFTVKKTIFPILIYKHFAYAFKLKLIFIDSMCKICWIQALNRHCIDLFKARYSGPLHEEWDYWMNFFFWVQGVNFLLVTQWWQCEFGHCYYLPKDEIIYTFLLYFVWYLSLSISEMRAVSLSMLIGGH